MIKSSSSSAPLNLEASAKMSPLTRRTIVCSFLDPFSNQTLKGGIQRRVVALPRQAQLAGPSGLPGSKSTLPDPSSTNSKNRRTFLVFLSGFRSSRIANKPDYILKKCQEWNANCAANHTTKIGCLVPDYSGHGESAAVSTISNELNNSSSELLLPIPWTECGLDTFLDDAKGSILDLISPSPLTPVDLYIIGSSMGTWISTLVAADLKETPGMVIRGLLLLAPGFDFTSDLLPARLGPERLEEIERNGSTTISSSYDPSGYVITKRLLESGRQLALLSNSSFSASIRSRLLGIPVSLIWAADDTDLPPSHMRKCADWFAKEDVRQVVELESGGHRLSGDKELEVIWQTLENLLAEGMK